MPGCKAQTETRSTPIFDALRKRAAVRAVLDPSLSFSKERVAESAALTRQTCLNPAMWHELPFDIDEITVCLRAACAEATSDQCVAFSAQLADGRGRRRRRRRRAGREAPVEGDGAG